MLGALTSTKFITILVGLIALVGTSSAGLFFYDSAKKTATIAELREQIIDLQTDIMRRNHEMQVQANQFRAYNSKRHEFKEKLEQKYSIQPTKTDCKNPNITTLLHRSLSK